jgi:hypothetical protein
MPEKKLSELVSQGAAIDVLASALMALPWGLDALNAALAAASAEAATQSPA